MDLSGLLLLAVVGLTPPPLDDAEPIEIGEPEESPDVETERPLSGKQIPGLVGGRYVVGLEADRLYGAYEPLETSAAIKLSGAIVHPFSCKLENVRFHLSLLTDADSARVDKRLFSSPLAITQQELERQLPSPIITLGDDVVLAGSLDPGQELALTSTFELGDLVLDPRHLPRYVALVHGYRFVDPTVADLALVLQRGGGPDFAAIAAWADDLQEPADLDRMQRDQLMLLIERRFSELRAPPGLGDLQEIHGLLALVRVVATPEDLERLLMLERPLNILLTSAVITYDEAAQEETMLEMPLHGMSALPSRSDFLDAYEMRMQDLRRASLPRLLRLAFDPIDFREAPPGVLPMSDVRNQATMLLRPLLPTSVDALLNTTADSPELQRDILAFYVDVHHDQAIEPLLRWLLAHPDEVDGLGLRATATFGAKLVAPLLRHYVDPEQIDVRPVVRRLLTALPPETTPAVVGALRSAGVEIEDGEPTVTGALSAYERHESGRMRRRAADLERMIVGDEGEPAELGVRIKAAGQLARLAPELLQRNAEPVIELYVAAALAADEESAVDGEQILGQLLELPLGEAIEHARNAAALTRARLALDAGEHDEALRLVLEGDATLADARSQGIYALAVHRRFAADVAVGRFVAADELLRAAEAQVGSLDPSPLPIAAMRRQLFVRRYWMAMLGAVIAAGLLFGAAAWLLLRRPSGRSSLIRRAWEALTARWRRGPATPASEGPDEGTDGEAAGRSNVEATFDGNNPALASEAETEVTQRPPDLSAVDAAAIAPRPARTALALDDFYGGSRPRPSTEVRTGTDS